MKTKTIEIGDTKFALTALNDRIFAVWRTPKGTASASLTREQLITLGDAFYVLGRSKHDE